MDYYYHHPPAGYEWDAAKWCENLAKHAIDFAAIRNFEWATAVYNASPRHGELRWVAIGYIGPRLHFTVYTMRDGRRRIISLRKANQREERIYAQAETRPHQPN